MTFLNTNEILYERQFGFRHIRSTTHVLSVITENIRKVDDWFLILRIMIYFLKRWNIMEKGVSLIVGFNHI